VQRIFPLFAPQRQFFELRLYPALFRDKNFFDNRKNRSERSKFALDVRKIVPLSTQAIVSSAGNTTREKEDISHHLLFLPAVFVLIQMIDLGSQKSDGLFYA
jgi:hypothetical protein